jgi:nitrogenase-stabilizing/protective protein
MSRYEEIVGLTDTEEYFDFFDLDYDERLVYVKRFHIMKKYGEMIARGAEQIKDKDELLDFYKFALVSVYKNFENGYSPSAADIWNTWDNPSACSTCSTSTECSDIEEVSSGAHACTSQPSFALN